jgi:hypothetical protein
MSFGPRYGADFYDIATADVLVRQEELNEMKASEISKQRLDMQFRNLIVFEACTALAHLVQGSVLLGIAESYQVPLNIPYVVWPENGKGMFSFHVKSQGHIDLKFCLVAFFFLSASFQALFTVSPGLQNIFERYQVQPLRWIEYSFSASLMAIIYAVLQGICNVLFLELIFATFFLCMMLGLIQEVGMYVYKSKFENTKSRLRFAVFLPHLLGWVAFTSTILVFIISFQLSVSHSKTHPPTWVYGLYSSQFIVMSGFGFTQLVQQILFFKSSSVMQRKRVALNGELAYTIQSLLAKSVLCWVLYAHILAEKDIQY